MTRTTYHHGALRQALIDGAREILAERGHEQFSLNEVARRAGVSTAAPYRHFSGKDELLAAVADQGYATLHECLERAASDSVDVRDRLLRLAGAYVRFAHDHPELFVTMFRSRPGADPVGHDSFEVLLRAVVDAQAAALIPTQPSPELMARSIWATLHGLATLSLRQPHQRFGMDGAPEDLATSTLTAIFGL
ncbi:TetR/AcrR family transcriptional regulator [Streptomyces sp. NBC_01310]|uniref:TetR/AcrR family transcriptional regulator n=1 Tax=unclassified Streptomyces TaxID=2593676 RepID=UPI0035B65E8A|nr:TetR/AcrR family transcriptional regulator [Streptomyces sp. NBC_01310]